MATEYVKLVTEGPIARLLLDRPDLHNAFNDEMIAQFDAALDRVAADETIRVLVLAGTGKSFSAGADFAWMKKMKDYSRDENLADAHRLADLLEKLFALPQPTVARVHGAAIGGGTGLVAACDFAVASTRARFAFTEVRMGLAPAVISPYLMLRMGFRHCRRLFQTGQRFTAEEALAFGLVDEVVDEERLDEAIDALVAELLEAAPKAQRACKELARRVASLQTRPLQEYTAALIARLRTEPEAQERMAEFLFRRKQDREGKEIEAIAKDALRQLEKKD